MRCGPLRVGDSPSEFLDETHCFWVMCPHPCCWEAAQRVTRGVARRIQSRAPVRSGSLLQEEFPSLNIVNVSEWAKTRKSPKKNLLYRPFCSESYHPATSQSQLCSQSQNSLKDSNVRLESLRDLHVSDLNSVAKSLHSIDYKRNKDVKLSLAQISPLDRSFGASCGSVSMVMWIPNPKHISNVPTAHRRKSPHIAVRDLACVPSSRLCDIPKPNRKKSRNVQKTEHLQLACTQLASPNGRPRAPGHVVSQIALHTSDTDLAEPSGAPAVAAAAELSAGVKRGVLQLEPEPRVGPRPGPAAREPGARLRNQPAAGHGERDSRPRRGATRRALNRLVQYRQDSANRAEAIDWLRLRSQTYHWKKRDLQPNCDKDKPVLAPPQPPQHWASTPRLSKAILPHCHHRSTLEIGPAVCRRVERVEEMWGCGGDGCSDTSAAGGFPKLSQGSDPMHPSSLRQPLDTEANRKLNGENTNGSNSSALGLMDSAATLQNGPEFQATIGQESECAGRVSGRSLSRGTGDRDSGSDSDSEDEDLGSSESQPSTPPPSLRSDVVD
ncbi:hypothetical protein SKAU_G00003890 [Synaphobranchus kaupii]|uniref:Uncharacterized protein n=1 Tax=Synaphobranchus kaupii TaxID=118154 RepID=A0A9Q1G9W4_SYNKA|nr:hypothetical protein SKAU_G00003890 [Synaphobranchus kaupii]